MSQTLSKPKNVYAEMLLCPHCRAQHVKTLKKKPYTVCCQSNHIWHWCDKHQAIVVGMPASKTGCTCIVYDPDKTL